MPSQFAVFDDGKNSISNQWRTCLHACLQEFVMGLSLLLRGSLLEKLEWTFNLYDINGDGIITNDEMYMIVSSVYDIIGNFTEPRVDENSIRDHVDTVFKVQLYTLIQKTSLFTSYEFKDVQLSSLNVSYHRCTSK